MQFGPQSHSSLLFKSKDEDVFEVSTLSFFALMQLINCLGIAVTFKLIFKNKEQVMNVQATDLRSDLHRPELCLCLVLRVRVERGFKKRNCSWPWSNLWLSFHSGMHINEISRFNYLRNNNKLSPTVSHYEFNSILTVITRLEINFWLRFEILALNFRALHERAAACDSELLHLFVPSQVSGHVTRACWLWIMQDTRHVWYLSWKVLYKI